MPVKEDGAGFIEKVDEAEGPHLKGDDEEEQDASIRRDEVEGGEDAEESSGGSDHGDAGVISFKESGNEVEKGVEEGSGDSTEEVEAEINSTAHPAFDVRPEEEEADEVHDEVAEVGVEKLEA